MPLGAKWQPVTGRAPPYRAAAPPPTWPSTSPIRDIASRSTPHRPIHVGCIKGPSLHCLGSMGLASYSQGTQTDFGTAKPASIDLGTDLGEHPSAVDAMSVQMEGGRPPRAAAQPSASTASRLCLQVPPRSPSAVNSRLDFSCNQIREEKNIISLIAY